MFELDIFFTARNKKMKTKESTEHIDWVLCYLLYLFVATFHILLYSELTGKNFILPSHLTDDIHRKDQKGTEDSKSNELDDALTD